MSDPYRQPFVSLVRDTVSAGPPQPARVAHHHLSFRRTTNGGLDRMGAAPRHHLRRSATS